MKNELSDKDFACYLFDWLMNRSGADCCSRCVHSSMIELCDNCGENGIKDQNVCYHGMSAWAYNDENMLQ